MWIVVKNVLPLRHLTAYLYEIHYQALPRRLTETNRNQPVRRKLGACWAAKKNRISLLMKALSLVDRISKPPFPIPIKLRSLSLIIGQFANFSGLIFLF